MKKINFRDLSRDEILSRNELKGIVGGYDGSEDYDPGDDGSGGGGGTGGDDGSGDYDLGDDGSGSDDPNPKITACIGKKNGDACDWTYKGKYYQGHCKEIAPNYTRHCSDLI